MPTVKGTSTKGNFKDIKFPADKLPPKGKPRPKSERQLLEMLVEQGTESLALLGEIKEKLTNMANEVVTQVNAKLDEIEQTIRDEAAEIQAAIEAAGAGGATPEELESLNTRLAGVNAAIEALATAPAPPSE